MKIRGETINKNVYLFQVVTGIQGFFEPGTPVTELFRVLSIIMQVIHYNLIIQLKLNSIMQQFIKLPWSYV